MQMHGECGNRQLSYLQERMRYCYANFSDGRVQARIRDFDVDSPILCGKMESEDRITERKMKTLRENQMTLEDYFS